MLPSSGMLSLYYDPKLQMKENKMWRISTKSKKEKKENQLHSFPSKIAGCLVLISSWKIMEIKNGKAKQILPSPHESPGYSKDK